jgi:hypothetical protein
MKRQSAGAALGGGADGEDYRNRFGQFALNARANFRGFKKIHK